MLLALPSTYNTHFDAYKIEEIEEFVEAHKDESWVIVLDYKIIFCDGFYTLYYNEV